MINRQLGPQNIVRFGGAVAVRNSHFAPGENVIVIWPTSIGRPDTATPLGDSNRRSLRVEAPYGRWPGQTFGLLRAWPNTNGHLWLAAPFDLAFLETTDLAWGRCLGRFGATPVGGVQLPIDLPLGAYLLSVRDPAGRLSTLRRLPY